MYYGLGANLTLVVHFTFIVFVIFGALLVFASKKIAFIKLIISPIFIFTNIMNKNRILMIIKKNK